MTLRHETPRFAAACALWSVLAGPAPAQTIASGQIVTPTATPGALFQPLNPGLADAPYYNVDGAMSLALSPDQKTLLILTTGYNRLSDSSGNFLPADSTEWVFVYDVSGTGNPVLKQTVPVPNTFAGIAWAPNGGAFYVAGGVDDAVHTYAPGAQGWAESGAPIALNHHGAGNGLVPKLAPQLAPPSAAGIAVTADGSKLVVANLYNDSISIIDPVGRTVLAELDLRPGKINAAQAGVPGGEYPFWVAIQGSGTAYVSSMRDREVDVVSLGATPQVTSRIPVPGNPNKMILNQAQNLLFVAQDNADAVAVIDTTTNAVTASIPVTAPAGLLALPAQYRGAAPNALALSSDETRLYVSDGGINAVAVVALNQPGLPVLGLIPTGWYPNAVAYGPNGNLLYVVNSKSVPGPNPGNCYSGAGVYCYTGAPNEYVLQTEKAGFLTAPVPTPAALAGLTQQVAANNHFALVESQADQTAMAALRQQIKHVIYIVRENRTYDQVLGDLPVGNGDPKLVEFGQEVTPNQHRIAASFVALDNFYDPGSVSGNGWPWSTAARESDFGVKVLPPNYAGRGLTYEWEGTNRDVNIAIPTLAGRITADPIQGLNADPDLLPGTGNVAAPDGPGVGEQQLGYLWDAAFRAGASVRNYGFMLDLTLENAPKPFFVPLDPTPFADQVVMAVAANPTLAPVTDPYFRGFDNAYPDFWREQEWEREFALYQQNGSMPALQLVRFMHDHTGNFDTAIDGVNTPELEVADNDYAVGRLVDAVAHSAFAASTLIFVVEDDAQDGPDHVDAHRSIAYVVGPYVKHRQVVSTRYSTVNMLRTIEDVLGLDHLSLLDAYAGPMTDVFDLSQTQWSFGAQPSALLLGTTLPLPAAVNTGLPPRRPGSPHKALPVPIHDAAWWARRTAKLDFSAEDKNDAVAFNRLLWRGLKPGMPYPTARSGVDLRQNRAALLKASGIVPKPDLLVPAEEEAAGRGPAAHAAAPRCPPPPARRAAPGSPTPGWRAVAGSARLPASLLAAGQGHGLLGGRRRIHRYAVRNPHARPAAGAARPLRQLQGSPQGLGVPRLGHGR